VWTATTFLILGILFLLVEVFNPGFFIAVPGGTLFIMGGIGLLAPDLMFGSPWAWLLWPLAAVLSTGANLFLYKRWAPAGDRPLTLGSDSLPGQVATVVTPIAPGGRGEIRIAGQTWSARSAVAIPAGAEARIVRVEGVYAVVEPA
jgi:membrane protein implicated in regulation of membrane protease activity